MVTAYHSRGFRGQSESQIAAARCRANARDPARLAPCFVDMACIIRPAAITTLYRHEDLSMTRPIKPSRDRTCLFRFNPSSAHLYAGVLRVFGLFLEARTERGSNQLAWESTLSWYILIPWTGCVSDRLHNLQKAAMEIACNHPKIFEGEGMDGPRSSRPTASRCTANASRDVPPGNPCGGRPGAE